VPLPLPEPEAEPTATGVREQVITGYKGPRRKLLVVDDIPSNRAVLVDLLQPVGFEVVEAGDGLTAVTLAQQIRPDLILMDRRMPGMNGLEAARQIRQNPALQAVPLISLSASVAETDQSLSREAGYDAFLPKPISWPRLAALLAEYLHLEWEYVSAEETGGQTVSGPLEAPPAEILAELYEFAKRGDIRRIRAEAIRLEELGERYLPFARRLRGLVEGYQVRAIVALLEQYFKRGE
jgi:CheY-like chemotaxis protein